MKNELATLSIVVALIVGAGAGYGVLRMDASHAATVTLVSTTVVAGPPNFQALASHGVIQLLDGGTLTAFTYVQWNSSTPSSFTLGGVKFSIWTNTTVTNSGGTCYGVGGYGGYVLTFPDGKTESMTTCTVGPYPPMSIRLSSHVNPQAGLLIVPSTDAVYFLTSG